MENIGYKLRVPSKEDRRSWVDLEDTFRAEILTNDAKSRSQVEERKKLLRTEIDRLSKRPLTKGRAEVMKELRKELNRLIGA